MDRPDNFRIKRVEQEAPDIKRFVFDEVIDAEPGQFLMIWVKGVDEIPMSPSSIDPLEITVRRVGEATKSMFKLEEGDYLGIRGPYGSSFSVNGEKILIVGGGVGIAPLLPLAKEARDHDLSIGLGALNSDELIYLDELEGYGDVFVSTEDGSSGYEGYITEAIEEINKYDSLYACGPEPMLYNLFKQVRETDIYAEFSLHRYIKCGVGICGSCCMDPDGTRLCVDGPIFSKEELVDTEFGEYRRDSSGRKEYI
ncbi:MAG: NAD(P)H-flavin reductase Mcr1 [Candidatus Methanohalarchaeum thermophilum]|uniref:Probable dihydroorotate dehydrogenase B (NAD(+)), electron transfer subunit n=1 Tax=Methanohalarchaeum thermophilum TaxID=1903181 RepID=A0A1Q6DXJ3_METT1|nr:MAG: NAD(P)H-flavin reductase Mcr1 [Candidatus Methanohalarchaeum thermophilum]